MNQTQKNLQTLKREMPKNVHARKNNAATVHSLKPAKKATSAKPNKCHSDLISSETSSSFNFFKLKLDPDAHLSTPEKVEILKDAIANGISKSKIEGTSHGVMARLIATGNIKQKTLEKLYSNLLAFFGYSIDIRDHSPLHAQSAPERIRSLEIHVATLLKQIDLQSAQLQKLHDSFTKLTKSPSSRNRPRKILGLTVTLKTTKSHGHTYKNWYAIAKDSSNHRRMIYLGKDLTNAESKIKQALLNLQGA